MRQLIHKPVFLFLPAAVFLAVFNILSPASSFTGLVNFLMVLAALLLSRQKGTREAYRKGFRVFAWAAAWFGTVKSLSHAFGEMETEELSVSMSAETMNFFGHQISQTIVVMWGVMAVLFVFALLFRLLAVPRLQQTPEGLQGIMELLVEMTDSYAREKTGHYLGMNLSAYLFSLGFLMAGCAASEIFRFRSPTSDITITFALGLISFFLLYYYGFKIKGVWGKIKSMGLILPLKLISDISVPVSLSCRLFGNMLGGLIVMDLLYMGLGYVSVGLQGVIGIYFSIIHPLLQLYIFVTLTLSFINESIE